MTFGLKSCIIIVAIIAAVIAAAFIAFADPPKFDTAIYFLAAGLALVGVAHFVKE